MKIHRLLILFLLFSSLHFLAQTFVGQLNSRSRICKATLRINTDSSFVMVCQNDSNSLYTENYGNISKLGGELYSLNIVNGFEKQTWPSTDEQYGLPYHQIYVYADSSLISSLKPIFIKDPYGVKHDYNLYERPSLLLNKVPRQPYQYRIYTNKKDTFTGKSLTFTGYSNNLTFFRRPKPSNLLIIISKGKLSTVRPEGLPSYLYYNLQLKLQSSKK